MSCPTPRKVPYPSRDTARKAVDAMRPMCLMARIYECSCGSYHLSTSAYEPQRLREHHRVMLDAMREFEAEGKPGAPELWLAGHLEVSRRTVRSWLVDLRAAGLVRRRRSGSTFWELVEETEQVA